VKQEKQAKDFMQGCALTPQIPREGLFVHSALHVEIFRNIQCFWDPKERSDLIFLSSKNPALHFCKTSGICCLHSLPQQEGDSGFVNI